MTAFLGPAPGPLSPIASSRLPFYSHVLTLPGYPRNPHSDMRKTLTVVLGILCADQLENMRGRSGRPLEEANQSFTLAENSAKV